MAKFYGVIGYAVTEETKPGVWTEKIIERMYYGDLTRKDPTTDGGNDGVEPRLPLPDEIIELFDKTLNPQG